MTQSPWPTLRRRGDFLLVQKQGARWATPCFYIQILIKPTEYLCQQDSGLITPHEATRPVRIGYTVTKKLSKSAVVRNRIRRRLREAVRLSLHNETLILPQGQGVMIVLSARDTAQTMPLPEIVKNLRWSLHRLGIIAK